MVVCSQMKCGKDVNSKFHFAKTCLFTKCGCTVLEMANYTQRALPESFGGLKSLVKLGVYMGQLEELPVLETTISGW